MCLTLFRKGERCMFSSKVERSTNEIHAHFMKEFCDGATPKHMGLIGTTNYIVSKILSNNFLDQEKFANAIKKSKLDFDKKEKAIEKANKHFQIVRFRSFVGGTKYSNSDMTFKMVQLFTKYIDNKIDKDNFLVSLNNLHVPMDLLAEIIDNLQFSENLTSAQSFKKEKNEIKQLYKNLPILRNSTEYKVVAAHGGAVNVGYHLSKIPNSKVGIMIASNSGLPGGALGKRPSNVTARDMKLKTQEESIWANAVLTSCGVSPFKQQFFYEATIAGKWGMVHQLGRSTDTLQNIDFTKSTDPKDYNQVYLLNNVKVSPVDSNLQLVEEESYPLLLTFADSVNANESIGEEEGTMQRTLNERAINDYSFFCECIKEKLRSALDGMASQGITHVLVAKLSCGVYAGIHKKLIKDDFGIILQDLLNEEVGPNGEKRGQYFTEVIIPEITPKG